MLNFAIQTARDAGRVLAEKFGRAIRITNKGDIDLVTEADLAAERLIIERIRSHHPRHSILSEEAGDVIAIEGEQSEYKWIVDPLDGVAILQDCSGGDHSRLPLRPSGWTRDAARALMRV